MKTSIPALLLITTLSACGGGGSGSGSSPVEERGPAYGLLKPAESAEEFTASLRRGLVDAYSDPFAVEPIFTEVEFDAEGGADEGSSQFSTTNLQELGVDEADIVKYDGEVLYHLGWGPFPDEVGIAEDSLFYQPELKIKMFRTDVLAPATELIGELELGDSGATAEGLYVYQGDAGKSLWAISHLQPYYYWANFALADTWTNASIWIQSWQVDSPEQAVPGVTIEIEGSLLSSRRIDNHLYLATRFSPTVAGLIPYPLAEQVESNEALIAEIPLADFLPQLRLDGIAQELVSPEQCHIPNAEVLEASPLPADATLVTVTSINLDNPQDIQSVCLNVFASGFYASRESIYVTASSSAGDTLIHKIALQAEGPSYRGTGTVPGYIGTNNPAFLMSEHNGDLRVVSSVWQNNFFLLPVFAAEEDAAEDAIVAEEDDFGEHRLTILRESEDGQSLELVSQLPNSNRPERIGKPNENVYAARFIEDRAYVVTFEVIDPLYVIDLADPNDPRVAGELELPGFSTLLQPVGDNLLFGVGQEVPADGQAFVQGIKLALFDVADPENPLVLDQVVIGRRGTYSPALYDHHALTMLQKDDVYRIALPIERYEEALEGEEPWSYYGWSDSGLYQFELNPTMGSLNAVGTLITDQPSEEKPYSNGVYESRSVLHDEAVFFINYGEVWAQFWGEDTP